MTAQPGPIVLLGSGETAPSARKVYKWLFDQVGGLVHVGILETPAGFEPNSAYVARRVADYLGHRLQNYSPKVTVIPARKRNTPHSPDDPEIIKPLRTTNINFMGAGSPTYAVRQLQDTLAWHTLVARHYLGTPIILASASTLAFSAHTLPVYEIYKVGEELHWQMGLDFFGLYGLSLVFIPHWNNTEGGAELDTSRCFMGQPRFGKLLELLPPKVTVVGIDEHTALALDLTGKQCRVMGKGGVTLLAENRQQYFESAQTFPVSALGSFKISSPERIIPPQIWKQVQSASAEAKTNTPAKPSPEVLALVEARQTARAQKDWPAADSLRDQIAEMGWQVTDTPQGPALEPVTE